MLRKPILARCTDRRRRARRHPRSGPPSAWFSNKRLRPHGLGGVSFDFFVNWQGLTVPDEVWVKRLVHPEKSWPRENLAELIVELYRVDRRSGVNLMLAFCRVHGFQLHYILFRDKGAAEWRDTDDEIVDLALSTEAACLRVVNPGDIQERIRILRAEDRPIGPGGLRYGTSGLECYLSSKPYFWPGDVDLVLVDRTSLAVRALVEFKKHTLEDDIREQTILNYRDRDRLKYESLGLLWERLGVDVPLIMLYYPTRTDIGHVKVERVGGSYDDLVPVDDILLNVPDKQDPASVERLLDGFLEFIVS